MVINMCEMHREASEVGIRRIKAHEAVIDGEFVRIIKYSTRKLGFLIGMVFGFPVSLALVDSFVSSWQATVIFVAGGTFMCGCLCALICNGTVVRRIPKADLVEIKKYTWPAGVTVVLDDERVMRARIFDDTPDDSKKASL